MPTHIDLDKFKTVEHKTGGWTDNQIRKYPADQLEEMIVSADLVLSRLLETAEEQRGRLGNLRLIRERKQQLGG